MVVSTVMIHIIKFSRESSDSAMRGTGSARVRLESVQAHMFCPLLNVLRCDRNILGDNFVTHKVNLESFSGLGTGSRGLCRLARAF